MTPRYPEAPAGGVVDVLHGVEVPDPYRWLEDAPSARTQEWCAAQDGLAREVLDDLPGRKRIGEDLRVLAKIGMVGVSSVRRGRVFFLRREGDQEHPVLWIRDPGGAERVLIDPAELSPDATTTLDFFFPSVEGTRLAYGLSEAGDEESTLHVMDVETGADLGERIDRTRSTGVAWLPGGEAFYYVRRLPPEDVPEGEEHFHRRLRLHRIGDDPDDDPLVFGEGRDPRDYYFATTSLDGRWLVVHARTGTEPATDLYLADLEGGGELRPVSEGTGAEIHAVVRRGRLYVYTDLDAPRYRLCVADPERPTEWRDLVGESGDVLQGWALGEDAVLLSSLRDAAARLAVHDIETGELRSEVELPGLGQAWLVGDVQPGDEAYVGFTSFTTPVGAYRYRFSDDTLEPWALAPGDFDPEPYRTEQVFYRSKDGTRIPMFVVRRADLAHDGSAPGLLTGYGGFNVAYPPSFTALYVEWLRLGGVLAVAGIRGSGEYGKPWHEAGRRERKQNVFDDFLEGAEHLVGEGFVAPDRLGIMGGSNGGLLVGAAMTQRPELFRAVVCSAPLLDMVRQERFVLGRLWTIEYGSADDPEEFRWLHGYSPYHRVEDGVDYPAVLFKTYESDSRVDPLHARKMCARLQAASKGEGPIVLRRETAAGHAAKSTSRWVEDHTETLAFLCAELGVDPQEAGRV